MQEIQESKDLIGVMLGIHNEATFNYSLDFYHKQQKLMKDVDYLDVIVNTLNTEVDALIAQMDFIENKLNLNESEKKPEEKDKLEQSI
jgi:hypothetical protein